ncbi:hypothetical protein [Pantoea agglomerans]|uniref:hypothetical protein n=1 Tax=Enterobacter agglomerans TaxID=549 RepID=UPI000A6B3F45|nr:hypothetical protein [Pantoea agglomerans]
MKRELTTAGLMASTSHEYHMLLSRHDFKLAEAACERIGENWWPPECPVCSQGCYWQFDRGSVWLKSLLLPDAAMARDISALGVFDEWVISGSPQAPGICDHEAAAGKITGPDIFTRCRPGWRHLFSKG